MFGISFSELLLVGLVALLVLGPERLPGAARTAGLWVGRLKRSFNAIKQEVEREIGADEIRRQLHNEHILSMEEEARKILQPKPANTQSADAQPVSPSADAGSIAPAESASVSAPPVHTETAQPAHTATTPVTTPDPPVQNVPSANDSTQPPRAP